MSKVIVLFDGKEWEVELDGDRPLEIGRSSQCGLCLKDTALSRDHCKILQEGEQFVVVDSGSRNGTKVNGRSTKKTPLRPGDVIQIGNVTIHFEKKRIAPPTGPRPAPREEDADPRMERLPHVLNDYLVSSGARSRGTIRKTIPWIAAAAVLAIAVVVWLSSKPSGGKETTVVNLIRVNPSFESAAVGDLPTGWRIVGGERKSWLRVERNLSKEGVSSLAVEKHPSAEEFDVTCLQERRIPVKHLSGIETSVWAKGDARAGYAGIRVSWYDGEGSRTPLAEEYATKIVEGAEWNRIEGTFRRPLSAVEAEVALVTFGRGGGIVYFDDVRAVAPRKAPTAAEKAPFGAFEIGISPNGAIAVSRKGREIVANVHLRVVTRDGVSTQLYHAVKSIDRREGTMPRMTVAAEIVNPVNLESVPLTIDLQYANGDLSLKYEISAARLSQVDRVEIVAALVEPREHALLEGSGNIPTRVSFTGAGLPLVLEYLDIMTMREERDEGRVTLTAARETGGSPADVAVGFTLGEPLLNRESDLRTELAKAVKSMEAKKYGEGLTLYGKLRRVVTDPAILQEIDRRLTEIQTVERAARKEIELRLIEANISRRKEHVAELEKAIGGYIAMFDGAPSAEEMKEIQSEVPALLTGAETEAIERRARELEGYAEGFAGRGMSNLAVSAAEKAKEILEKSQPKDVKNGAGN